MSPLAVLSCVCHVLFSTLRPLDPWFVFPRACGPPKALVRATNAFRFGSVPYSATPPSVTVVLSHLALSRRVRHPSFVVSSSSLSIHRFLTCCMLPVCDDVRRIECPALPQSRCSVSALEDCSQSAGVAESRRVIMLLLWSGLAAPSQLGGKHTTHTRLRLRVTWMERVRRRVRWRWCCWAKKRFFFVCCSRKQKRAAAPGDMRGGGCPLTPKPC